MFNAIKHSRFNSNHFLSLKNPNSFSFHNLKSNFKKLLACRISSSRLHCSLRSFSKQSEEMNMSERSKIKVAVSQMTSNADLDSNFRTCSSLIQKAAASGAVLISLPECFSFMGENDGDSVAIAQSLSGPIIQKFQKLAKDFQMWISLGGFQEVGPSSTHIFNAHVLLDSEGKIQSVYRKIHLFDVNIPGGPVLKESNRTKPGSEIVTSNSPAGNLGLTVCYDLRFPELYQCLRFVHNAQVILVPAAFTKPTGEAHWEILLRSRAIECQCYILASAQTGKHNEKRESYGKALIIDPWGKIIAECNDRLCTDIAVAEIDLNYLDSIRQRIPIDQHRRYDLYDSFKSSL